MPIGMLRHAVTADEARTWEAAWQEEADQAAGIARVHDFDASLDLIRASLPRAS